MFIELNEQEHATILAALRYYQENDQGEPNSRSNAIDDIATNGDEVISLDSVGIDDLCERLNCDTKPEKSLWLDPKKMEQTFVEWHLDDEISDKAARSYARRLINRLAREARA